MDARIVRAGTYAVIAVSMAVAVGAAGYAAGRGTANVDGAFDQGWSAGEDALLERCYHSVFELVARHGLRSVSFPAISCGTYGYPLDRAAAIAVRTIRSCLEQNAQVERVHVVCFDDNVYDAYWAILNEMAAE